MRKPVLIRNREAILKLIENGPGFHVVNKTVAEYLRTWIAQTCDKVLQQHYNTLDTAKENLLHLAVEVGTMQREMGWVPKSKNTLKKAKDLAEKANLMDTTIGVKLIKELGVTLRMNEDSDGAQACFQEQHRIMKSIGTLASEEGHVLVRDLGWTLFCQDKPEAALGYMNEAREVAEAASLLHTTGQGAILLSATGSTLTALGRFDEAVTLHEEAVQIMKDVGDINNNNTQ